jgi:hypothetical protein
MRGGILNGFLSTEIAMAGSTQDLDRFVRDALARGSSRERIDSTLKQAGWAPEQVQSALAAYAEVDFEVPVPRPRPHLSARDAFVYLVLFTTLYISAYHFGSLLFSLINRAFPDPTDRYQLFGPSIRWSVASIVIAFPLFLIMSARIARTLREQPVKRLSAVRRWLTYLTLFLAAVILIGDLITLVYQLLGGSLTIRFVLKVLVVGVIAAAVFGYYLWDLRRDEAES